jgi:HEAT repeat protein
VTVGRKGWLGIVAGLAVMLAAGIFLLRGRRAGPTSSSLIEALRRPAAPPTPPAPAVRAAPHPPSPDELASILRDSSWQDRLAAVNALAERRDIPVGRRAELLLGGLEREVARPTDSLRFEGSYLPSSSTFRLQFMRVIEGLGPDAIPPARQAAARASGAAREWLVLARAGAGDPEVVAPLRELLRTSAAPPVRMTAARLLGRFKQRSAVPELQAALRDSFVASTGSGDLKLPPGSFYPVREQAAASLRALGVDVRREGDNFTIR